MCHGLERKNVAIGMPTTVPSRAEVRVGSPYDGRKLREAHGLPPWRLG